MGSIRFSRTLSVSSACLVAAVGTGLAAPAQADDLKLTLQSPGSVHVSSDVRAVNEFFGYSFSLGRVGNGTAHGVKVTYDATGLAGLAQLAVPGCAAAGPVFTCDQDDVAFNGVGLSRQPTLRAVQNVRLGAVGTLHVTVKSSNAATASADVKVAVGGPDLKLKALAEQSKVKPGSPLDEVVEFANLGNQPTSEVVLTANLTAGLTAGQRPSNCEFADKPAQQSAGNSNNTRPPVTLAVCTVDAAVGPGEVFRLDTLKLGVAATASFEAATFQLFGDENDANSPVPGWRKNEHLVRGTAPALGAAKATDPALLAAPRQGSDYSSGQKVTADFTADLSATSQWTPGPGADEGTLTIGIRNSGPASYNDPSAGDLSPRVHVVLPQGVTVSDLPGNVCGSTTSWHNRTVSPATRYFCGSPAWMPVGYQQTYSLHLKLATGVDRVTVPVTLQNYASEVDNSSTSAIMPWDHNPANDVASATLVRLGGGSTPPTSTPSTRPTSAPTGRPTPTSTGTDPAVVVAGSFPPAAVSMTNTDGRLASTGNSGTGTMIVAGSAAVAIGAGLVLVATRRRAGTHK
ncbi:hypothetical protein [Kitasatospora sp. MAP5-34]|uniref:hypothetical protein n=1 Tax=Kitasatospora sp. MAP5-34 TaxID=3035102 RepID=UPI002475C829|nr:hypothetical protein [Kitasatospora sp. MAP5-34]MDH6576733.1 hypothetical protein [Kitasatospora sp. MAP5-34]